MLKKSKAGFSLIELMTSVCLIGVLLVIAVPAYKDYAVNAKYAQTYVDLDAFSKSQYNYFLDYQRFVTITPPAYALIRKNGKYRVIYPENEVSWSLLQNPISEETFFGYMSVAGYTNQIHRHYLSRGIDGEISDRKQVFRHQNLHQKTVDLFLTEGGDACQMYFDYSALGLGEVPSQDWAVMIAGADFAVSDPEVCSVSLQIVKFQDGEFRRGPILFVNRGE
jgi:prepilin-type N-terminal cleavage/methylation domain-containing protein